MSLVMIFLEAVLLDHSLVFVWLLYLLLEM